MTTPRELCGCCGNRLATTRHLCQSCYQRLGRYDQLNDWPKMRGKAPPEPPRKPSIGRPSEEQLQAKRRHELELALSGWRMKRDERK